MKLPPPGRVVWLLAAAAAWVGIWSWLSRGAVLDDALIHLRYAHNLRDHGLFTFDGRTPSYGVSSPLFVALLALGSHSTGSPLLGKTLSVVCYGALLALLAALAARATSPGRRAVLAILAVSTASPMGIRWQRTEAPAQRTSWRPEKRTWWKAPAPGNEARNVVL